ncbi:unnamed protein product [Cylicocyclus nassatus]|uniref:Uncharacterized protein n=1 Tax=Cylicocyclus nassatus TaxID=53992 RepID=A0AA36GQ74_CYLNA|nr:unnamed protein product [Cylicocyclus nassatus]
MSRQLLDESAEYMVLEEERERLERNHERFAELLDQLERRTEELQLLQRLTEARLRLVEDEAERVRNLRFLRNDNYIVDPNGKANESLIRSDAYGKCTICLEDEPLDPVGCIYCQQLVGCRRCARMNFIDVVMDPVVIYITHIGRTQHHVYIIATEFFH